MKLHSMYIERISGGLYVERILVKLIPYCHRALAVAFKEFAKQRKLILCIVFVRQSPGA